ncbi:MAG: hypothetical protein EBR02_07690 [Alphaproteobacteria bacterium]|nr:hypothetical protein [Alphaproteobacteria bacterium]
MGESAVYKAMNQAIHVSAPSPLFQAIYDKDIDAVRRELSSGADVNARNEHGDTPLGAAFYHPPSPEISTLLIEAGADVNAQLGHDYIALHHAVLIGHVALVNLLLKKGDAVNAVGRWGCTPLHFAVHDAEANIEIVRALLSCGADVNARAGWGHTPLHYAVADNQDDIAELLIKHGADTSAKATWLKRHKYYNGHYDTVMLMIRLDDDPQEPRQYNVTPLNVLEG